MAVLVGKKAPSFKANAVVNGEEIVENFSLDQYLEKNMWCFSSTRKTSRLCAQQSCMHFKKN